MGRPAVNLINRRFGRLVVKKLYRVDKLGSSWICKCDCGIEIVAYAKNLKKGSTKSCGCLRVETLEKNRQNTRNFKKKLEKDLKKEAIN